VFMKYVAALVAIIVLIAVFRLGELYTQLARYKTYWLENNKQVIANSKPDSIRYYALGDSAAQAVGATSPKKGYVSLIAKELENRSKKDVELINLSKSGAKVADVTRDQLPIMNSLGVKESSVVTIEIGANDMLTYDETKFEREMDELMSKLPKQTIISDVPSFAGSRFAKYEKNILSANKILVRLSDKHNLKRALLYDKLTENHGWQTFAADIFHPSNKGYRENWAPAFIEQL
jgi:acyl-CoA thioesterase I